ncbi:PREDICTED: uncharacterized protein LOC101810721, partial [Ficedula albicollis]|uniref:uncharacterized protein LOC101810721 n=1 Tax=Ficedula albicollis TaxID=59894 RepID=UPI0007AD7CF1
SHKRTMIAAKIEFKKRFDFWEARSHAGELGLWDLGIQDLGIPGIWGLRRLIWGFGDLWFLFIEDSGILGFVVLGTQGLWILGIRGFCDFGDLGIQRFRSPSTPRNIPVPHGILPIPAVPVALDAEARPLDLGDAQDPIPVPALVARDALGAGQRYWEVELGRERRWALGVLHSRDPRDSRAELWALRASQGQLFSSRGRALGAQRRHLSALGVFLDREKAQLEFYDVDQKDLVAGIPLGDPTGKFFPFVSQGEEGMLRIRPVPVPVPL